MGSTVEAPESRNYAQETRDTLQAQIDLAPAKYAAEAKYAPLYQNLQLGLLQQALPQLLDAYTKQIAPALSQVETSARSGSRAADIQDVATLGPQAREAQRAANPEVAGLIDEMVKRGKIGLDAGTALTPEEARQAQQQSRQAFAARGLAYSPGGAVDEVVRSQLAGQGAYSRRLAQATGAAQASQGFYGDQFQQILGRPSQVLGMTPGVAGQASGYNPGQLFSPESQYAGDLYNQAWQGKLAARTATAANDTAVTGAAISAAGSALSSL